MSAFSSLLLLHSILLVCCICLSLRLSTATILGNETDRLALLAFKSQITLDPLNVTSSWNDSHHFCVWEGVTCGRKHRRVSILNLESKGLAGSISPHIGNLSFLRTLVLQNNSLQEYGMSAEVSTQGDVYSYGILLQEMFTGKRPTDNMFKDGLCLHEFSKMALPQRVMDIIDIRLLSEEEASNQMKGCLNSIIRIGVACSVELASERMAIKDVLNQLHAIKQDLQD